MQKHSYICKVFIKKFDITINVTDHYTPGTQLLHKKDFLTREISFCKSVTTLSPTYNNVTKRQMMYYTKFSFQIFLLIKGTQKILTVLNKVKMN